MTRLSSGNFKKHVRLCLQAAACASGHPEHLSSVLRRDSDGGGSKKGNKDKGEDDDSDDDDDDDSDDDSDDDGEGDDEDRNGRQNNQGNSGSTGSQSSSNISASSSTNAQTNPSSSPAHTTSTPPSVTPTSLSSTSSSPRSSSLSSTSSHTNLSLSATTTQSQDSGIRGPQSPTITTSNNTSPSSPITPAGASAASATSSPSDSDPGSSKAIVIPIVFGFVVTLVIILILGLKRRRRMNRSLSGNTLNRWGTLNRMGSRLFYADRMVRAITRRFNSGRKPPSTVEDGELSPTTTFTGSYKWKEDYDESTSDIVTLEKHDPPLPIRLETRNPFRAWTDRQMQIEQKIIELESQLITAYPGQKEQIRDRIEKLKELRVSDWAYGRASDNDIELPEDLKGP